MAQLSEPLNSTINGNWAEKQEGFAVLTDVDKGTFLRFAQWAYNGYYTPASFSIKPNENQMSNSPDGTSEKKPSQPSLVTYASPVLTAKKDDSDDAYGSLYYKSSKKDKKKGKKTSNEWFYGEPEKYLEPDEETSEHVSSVGKSKSRIELEKSFKQLPTTARRSSIGIAPPRPNTNAEEDYTEVFLCHARMYVFAAQKMIPSLRTLALEELHATLAAFTLYNERTGDIVALLRFIYESETDLAANVDELRILMSHYIGWKMDTLVKDEALEKLMREDKVRTLLGDFLKMVGQRL